MFGMFPFMYNNNNYNNNETSSLNSMFSLINNDLINNMVGQLLSGDAIDDLLNNIFQEDNYDVELKDYGGYYLIKGYLPGLGPKDVSIDFEKNKAILTIHRNRKQKYSNGSNVMVTVMQSGTDIVKNFYIEEVDVTKLSATFDDSVLLLTIPKLKKQEYKSEDNSEPTIIDVENYKIE